MFRDALARQAPPNADRNGTYYHEFLSNLKKLCPSDDVNSFSTHLKNYLRGRRDAMLTRTLLIIFWIKLQCFLKDNLEHGRQTGNIIAEFTKILEDTFSGDSCLTKCTSEHADCNCFCIGCVNDLHEIYYSKIYKKSRCCRQNCNPLTNCFDLCCTCLCRPICFVGGLLVAIAVIVGGTIAIINVF